MQVNFCGSELLNQEIAISGSKLWWLDSERETAYSDMYLVFD